MEYKGTAMCCLAAKTYIATYIATYINLPDYKATYCDENIKVAVYDCLNEANNSFRYNSLAFPALGTEGLKYPADVTAKSMFKHVKSWLSENSNVRLKLISFVVFPNDIKSVEG